MAPVSADCAVDSRMPVQTPGVGVATFGMRPAASAVHATESVSGGTPHRRL